MYKDILKASGDTGMMPVFYHQDQTLVLKVVSLCYKLGIRAFEFTNRGANALVTMKYLHENRHLYPEMLLGIGTLFSAEQSKLFIDTGVDFVVSPILNPTQGAYCLSRGIPWVPGCGSATEVYFAKESGAELIKIFPADVLGTAFVKAVLGPIPGLHLMPTGGVTTDPANLSAWFKAGVHCVGMGSALFTKSALQEDGLTTLTTQISAILKITKEELSN